MATPVRTSVVLSLVDPITQETYKIIVAPEDAEKAGQDLVFATQLFKQAKLQAEVSAKLASEAKAPIPPKALPVVKRIAVVPKALPAVTTAVAPKAQPVVTRIMVVSKALPAVTTTLASKALPAVTTAVAPKAQPVVTRIMVVSKALPAVTTTLASKALPAVTTTVASKPLPAVTTAELRNSSAITSIPLHCSYEAEAGTSTSESPTENIETPDDKDEGDCIWTKPMVMLLVRTYKEKESNFTSGKMSQKRAWEQLSDFMSTKGYMVSGSKCASKFSSLKRTYKSVKDHNNKSGNQRRTWYFMDLMDELFSSKPWVEPVSTASSDSQNKSDTESNTSTSDSSIRQKATRKRQRASDTLMERLIEVKQKYAEQKQLQHNEKIAEARRLSAILEKLLAKKTQSRFYDRTSDFDENDTTD